MQARVHAVLRGGLRHPSAGCGPASTGTAGADAGSDPERARSVRERARKSVERLAEDFPGDPATGLLDASEEAEARFEDFANDEPCAALDPGPAFVTCIFPAP